MKKIVLVLLLVMSYLNANSIWDKMIDLNQVNKIIETGEDEKKSEKIISDKINLYKQINKDVSLSLLSDSEVFYDRDKGYEKKLFYKRRIKTNKKNGNTYAVTRDEISIELLDLKYSILVTLESLSLNLKDEKAKELNLSLLEEIYNKQIQREGRIVLYKKALETYPKTSKIVVDSQLYLAELITLEKTYIDYIKYTKEHYNILFKKESLLELLKIEEIIQGTNNNQYIKQINYYLQSFNTDFPRLVLFCLIIFLFWGFNEVLKNRILPLVRDGIDKIEKEEVDIFLNSFEKIKRPITYIVMLFGIEVALKVLLYPEPLNASIKGGINVSYIIFFTMIALTSMNILFASIFETKKGKRYNSKRELILHGRKLVKILIVIGGGLYGLQSVGFDISAFLASLGLMGMAIALAAKDTLANLFGSVVILSDRPFRIGDWVTFADGTDGTIEEIGIRSTKVRTFKRTVIYVPNSKVANGAIENWSMMDKRRIKHEIGLDYRTTTTQMRAILENIRTMLKEHDGIHKDTIYIYFKGFGSSDLTIFCYYFTKSTNWAEFMAVREDTNLLIMEIIEKHNTSFAFPTQSIYIENAKDLEGRD